MWEDDDEPSDDAAFDPEAQRDRMERLPVFQKAEEIRELTRRIIDAIENEQVKMIHSNTMLEDSMVVSTRIARAEAADDYISKMEHATVVKMHARSLQSQTASLLFEEVVPQEYLRLLRKEIEDFRLLFREWIKSFHGSSKEDDGWGLFIDNGQ